MVVMPWFYKTEKIGLRKRKYEENKRETKYISFLTKHFKLKEANLSLQQIMLADGFVRR
jgi:hypothetical protein